jgi:hypothetical protein
VNDKQSHCESHARELVTSPIMGNCNRDRLLAKSMSVGAVDGEIKKCIDSTM